MPMLVTEWLKEALNNRQRTCYALFSTESLLSLKQQNWLGYVSASIPSATAAFTP